MRLLLDAHALQSALGDSAGVCPETTLVAGDAGFPLYDLPTLPA